MLHQLVDGMNSKGKAHGSIPNLLEGDLNSVLKRSRAEWESLRGARIFITGGTGFIGTWLLDCFLRANSEMDLGTEVVVLTRNAGKFRKNEPVLSTAPGITLVEGDVRSFEFPKGPFTHVIHAATEASAKLNVDAPLVMIDTIVEGTRRALDFAQSSGATVFLNMSSGGTYGRQPEGVEGLAEDYPGAPDLSDSWSAYGEGKRVSELLGTIYSQKSGIEHKVARIFALVGPRLPLDAHYAIGNFIRDGLKGGPIIVGGDGTPYRSYMYASDLVVWLLKVLVKGRSCVPYNVGSEAAISIADLARKVSEVLGNGSEVVVKGSPMPGQRGSRYVPSTNRARAELGVDLSISLDEGIRRTANWARRTA
jgi:nucleoside-diphosphate-sugar epimerase